MTGQRPDSSDVLSTVQWSEIVKKREAISNTRIQCLGQKPLDYTGQGPEIVLNSAEVRNRRIHVLRD
jgi:hypothetical protein